MIGPLVQGVLLTGLIYWYSKGMLSLINDYYRDEFKTFLEKEAKNDKSLMKPSLQEPQDTCKSQATGGLLEVLDARKRDGIIIRGADNNADDPVMSLTASQQCKPPEQNKEKPSNNEKVTRQLLDSSKLDYVPDAMMGNDRNGGSKLILNPSATDKLGYMQITNQQVSDVNDGELSPSIRLVRDGNYASEGKSKTKIISPPRVLLNGNVIDLEHISTVVEISRQRTENTCRRKSVNEMVQYWTRYQSKFTANNSK